MSREVQSKGLWFNRQRNFKLTPDGEGHINLPTNTLSVIPTKQTFYTTNYVQRGNKLFDMENNTYEIGETIYVDITLYLAFDELPEVARYAITLRSARQFADGIMTSDSVHEYTEDDEQVAFAELERIHTKYRKPNMLTDSVDSLLANNRRI